MMRCGERMRGLTQRITRIMRKEEEEEVTVMITDGVEEEEEDEEEGKCKEEVMATMVEIRGW